MFGIVLGCENVKILVFKNSVLCTLLFTANYSSWQGNLYLINCAIDRRMSSLSLATIWRRSNRTQQLWAASSDQAEKEISALCVLILTASAFGCSYFDGFSFRVLLFWRLQLSGALILAASALCAIILAAPCVLILAALALCSLILAALSALLLCVPLFWRLRVPLFGGSGCPYLAAPCALIMEAQVAHILAASARGALILTAWLRVPLFWQLGSRCPYFGGSDWLQNKKI